MKILTFLIIFLLLMFSNAFAALSVVQHTGIGLGTVSSGSVTVTSTGSGNLLVVMLILGNTLPTTVTSVSDGANSFTQFPNAYPAGSPQGTNDVWYLPQSVSGKTSITVNLTGAPTFGWDIEFWEVSGFKSPLPDVAGIITNGAQLTGTATGAGVITTGTADFIVAGDNTSNAVTANPKAGNEFTSGGDIWGGDGYCSLITTTAGFHQPAWTDNGNTFTSSTAAFRDPNTTHIYNAKISNAKIGY